jgi:hypothetical protein
MIADAVSEQNNLQESNPKVNGAVRAFVVMVFALAAGTFCVVWLYGLLNEFEIRRFIFRDSQPSLLGLRTDWTKKN